MLSVPDPVKMHAYLQCLAGLSVLCPEPGCTGLSRGQSATYYRVVVRSGSLAGVPLGAKYSVYLAMLKGSGQCGQLLPLEDEAEHEETEPEQKHPMGASELFVWTGPKPKRPRARGSGSSAVQAGRQWAEMLCPGFVEQPCVPALQDGDPAESGAASSQDRPASAASARAARVASAVTPEVLLSNRVSIEGSRRIMLEGVYCTYEKRDDLGHQYERLRAKCPHCKGPVQRSWPKRQTASACQADVLPMAYVGYWLSQCKRVDGVVGSHRGWQPSDDEVLAYAIQQQWV